MRRFQKMTALALTLILGMATHVAEASPGTASPGTVSGPMRITKAVADLEDVRAPKVRIQGEHFGDSPTVFLGQEDGKLVKLTVISTTATSILAKLPDSIEPASYLLIVETGEVPQQTSRFHVTLEARGSEAP